MKKEKNINIRTDGEDLKELKKIAEEEKTTVSFLIRKSISDFIKKYKETKNIF